MAGFAPGFVNSKDLHHSLGYHFPLISPFISNQGFPWSRVSLVLGQVLVLASVTGSGAWEAFDRVDGSHCGQWLIIISMLIS